MNLRNPKTFGEKLQWIKLYDRNPDYTVMVDKYAVKDYVAKRINPSILIPTLAVWKTVDEIDLDALPAQFVLKCTHDSGSIAICRDKSTFNIEAVKEKFRKALSENYYRHVCEWPYKHVPPRIIAEEYLSELSSVDLIDYKFFCFNGNAAYCQVIKDRSSIETIDFFDKEWNLQEFTGLNLNRPPHSKTPICCPKNYDKMIQYAETLSKGIPFVRVDFYNLNGEIYFGELTFFPANGMGEFTPPEWNEIMGSYIDLSTVMKK